MVCLTLPPSPPACQVAYLNLTRRTVYNPNVTLLDLSARAKARIIEASFQQNDTLFNITIPPPLSNTTYDNLTVAEVVTYFEAGINNYAAGAGISPPQYNNSLPDHNDTGLGPLRTDYNLVTWLGNTTAYMICDLPMRGPTYVGTCQDLTNTCTQTTTGDASVPWTCTHLIDGVDQNVTVKGSLADEAYRADCEAPCDHVQDCNILCQCYGTCSSTQYCVCAACEALNFNAAADSSFMSIVSVAQTVRGGAGQGSDPGRGAGGEAWGGAGQGGAGQGRSGRAGRGGAGQGGAGQGRAVRRRAGQGRAGWGGQGTRGVARVARPRPLDLTPRLLLT